MDLKSRLGETAGPYTDTATAGRLQAFSSAVGARSRPSGFPTYLTVCRQGEFDLMVRFGIPLSRVLHGEQAYDFRRPIAPDSILTYSTRLAQVLEKRGSATPMQIMIFETEIMAGAESIGLARSTIIYRGGA